jgi:hypothetical protein
VVAVTPQAAPREEIETEYADVGKPVTLSASADGSPPLFFQWRKNGQAISGATGAEFKIQAANATDAGRYDCVVTNSAGASATPPVKLVIRTK